MRTITIQDDTAKPVVVPKKATIDLQDTLLVCGFILTDVGLLEIYPPAALIFPGVLCFFFAWLLAVAKRKP